MSLAAACTLLVAMVPIGCARSSRGQGGSATLRIAAASDLREVLPKLMADFPSPSGGRIEIVPVFGSSGALAEQIRSGAPFDLFCSANRKFVDDLVKSGDVLAESAAPYARGRLMLIVRRDLGLEIRSLEDLARPEIKSIALANPKLAPYGAAAAQAIERSGLERKLAPKLAIAETVAQAYRFVETGNADVGFVGKSVVAQGEVKVSLEIDPKLYDPIIQWLGVVARSRQRGVASDFARWMRSESGRKLLEAAGLGAP